MNKEVKQVRNNTVDILRGIAMLMVVLGHTMTGSTVDSQDSFLFNIVWTLQMPLFILISGYLTRYSKPLLSGKDLWGLVKKRTLAYLLPWIVWTFVVRGLIFQQSSYLNVRYIVYHMDSGYWFLFTIWMIAVVFGIADFIGRKVTHKDNVWIIATGAVYVVGMVVIAAIGLIMGLSFLGIKLTLYYMPFYFAGYLFGKIQPMLKDARWGETAKEIAVAVCLAVWMMLMNRYNFYAIGDSGMGSIIRAAASLAGCIAVCGLVAKLINDASRMRGGGYYS